MAQIKLTKQQVNSLVVFCRKNNVVPFAAKDHGAYFGASVGATPDKQCLFYFNGCNPHKDANFYDNACDKFGGDDFFVRLDKPAVETLQKMVDHPSVTHVVFSLTKRAFSFKAEVRR